MNKDEPLSGTEESAPHGRISLDHVTDWEALVVEARYSPRELCARCGFSMRHMQRFILKRFQVNLGWFVSAIRMMKAYNLLKSGFSVKETALGLGFKQVSHFCRSFKQHFHANPSTVILNAGLPGKDGQSRDSQLQFEFFKPSLPPRFTKRTEKRPPPD
jgi:AraC family transcriptional regulator, mar-sox-rob regulon activator